MRSKDESEGAESRGTSPRIKEFDVPAQGLSVAKVNDFDRSAKLIIAEAHDVAILG